MADKLIWTITDYGLNRITQALADPNNKLYLQKVKIGDANGTYYIPTSDLANLKNIKGTFNVNKKTTTIIDNNNAVVFITTVPETIEDVEIREVGLYETIDNVDYLFAISTCQPLYKPFIADNYSIAIDYHIIFISENLMSVYDQILLDPLSEFITEEDLSNLYLNLLFVENVLSEQISANTNIIGLDKPKLLSNLIDKQIFEVSNIFKTNFVMNIINFLNSINNLKSAWFFDHDYYRDSIQISDYSSNQFNLTLNKRNISFSKTMLAFASFLNIDYNNYFYLENDIDLDFLNSNNTDDSPFTLIFLLKHNNLNENNTIIAKSNYFTNENIFEINKLNDNSIEVKLFTDSNNYISFKTDSNSININLPYVLSISYNGNKTSPSLNIYINDIVQNTTLTSVGVYNGMSNISLPLTSYLIDSSNNSINNINSQVSFISIIKEQINVNYLKLLALNLLASSGVQP
jgi:hypothetical protein